MKEFIQKLKDFWWSLGVYYWDVFYWLAYRFVPSHQYHIVRTGLKPNYYEIDERMFNASFQLLVDYVEKQCAHMNDLIYPHLKHLSKTEKGIYFLDNEEMEKTNEIVSLYLWFKGEYKNWKDPFNDVDPIDLNTNDSKQLNKYKKQCLMASKEVVRREKIKTQKLIELVKIRSHLWT